MRKITFWLALILIFAIPWDNIVVIPGLGTLTRGLGLGVAAIWLMTVVLTGRFRRPQPIHLMLLLFVVWNSVTIVWTLDAPKTTERINTYLQLFGLSLILWEIFTTEIAIQAGLQAYVLGAYVSVSNTIFNYQNSTATNFERYAGDNFDPNDLGLILSLGLPMAWYLASASSGLWKSLPIKLINYAYIPLGIFGILLTASRTALLTTVPTWIFILLSIGQIKSKAQKATVIGLLMCSLVFISQVAPPSSLARISTVAESVSSGDLNEREAVWAEGIEIFLNQPVIGVGAQAFKTAAVKTHHVAHNTAISVLVESGMVGFGLFAIIIGITFRKAYEQLHRSSLWLNLMLIWVIGTLTLTWEHRKPTWLLLIFVTASAHLAQQERVHRHDGQRVSFYDYQGAGNTPDLNQEQRI